ncbi:MAG: hypothetical protein AAGA85_17445 [Bacteroidota bacterium]
MLPHRQNYASPLIISFLLAFAMCFPLLAQDRVQPARDYKAGEEFYAPLNGIKFRVPEGWSGYVPMGTDVFSMRLDSARELDIMVRAGADNLEQIKARLDQGSEMARGIFARPIGEFEINGSRVTGSFYFSNDKSRKGHVLAKCGEFGKCATMVVITPAPSHEKYKDLLAGIADNLFFVAPTLEEQFADYDWSVQLRGKYLVLYEGTNTSLKANHLWLCSDGTFRSKAERKGEQKGQAGPYSGNKKGTYRLMGMGMQGRLVLEYKKADDLDIILTLKDQQVYLNGDRYVVSNNTKCN